LILSAQVSIHPANIDGASIAVFIWDHTGECGGSAVLFGTSRFVDGEFFVDRNRAPRKLPIPESAWENLRINSNPKEGAMFEMAEYIVMLRLGPIPEDDPIDGFEKIDIPILRDSD